MSFKKDLKIGEIGKNISLKLFEDNKSISQVIDVRQDKKYQKWNIDFILKTSDNRTIKIEVKTDAKTRYTGNIAYETYSNKKYNTIGCFEKTRANYILYYVLNTNILYVIDIKKFKLRVYSHRLGELKEVPIGDYAMGYLFPVEELEQYDFMVRYELPFKIKERKKESNGV